MVRHVHRVQVLLLASFAVLPAAHATVFVVDAASGAGATHTEIAAAVLAAADGDTILVRSGTYGAFAVVGKGLVLVEEAGATASASSWLAADLAPGQLLVVRGLDGRCEIEDCLGSVRVEDVTAVGLDGSPGEIFNPNGFPGAPGQPAALVTDCASVAFVRCSLAGGHGGVPGTFPFVSPTDGGAGLRANGSRVALSGCTVTGGEAGASPSSGGPALYVVASLVHAAGCTVTGGDAFGCVGGPCSGSGVYVGDPASTVRLLDGDIAGGLSSSGAAPAFNAPAGTIFPYAGTARSITVDSPLREPEVGTLSLQGVQGDAVLLLISPATAHVDLPFYRGTLLVGSAPLAAVVVGPISNADGTLSFPFTVGELGPGALASTVQIQAAFIGPEGGILGPVSVLTALDSSL